MCGGNRDTEDHEDVDTVDLREMEAQTGNKSRPPAIDRGRSRAKSWSNMMSAIDFWGVVRIAGWLLFFALLVFGLYRGLRGSNTDGIPMAIHTPVPNGIDRKARGFVDKTRTTINVFNVPTTTDVATDAFPDTAAVTDEWEWTEVEKPQPAPLEIKQQSAGNS
eukprot:202823_1